MTTTVARYATGDTSGVNIFCHYTKITDGNILDEGSTIEFDYDYDSSKVSTVRLQSIIRNPCHAVRQL